MSDNTFVFKPSVGDTIIGNLWLNPTAVKKELGYKGKLDRYADCQILKEMPFGTIYYDCEEGIKIEAKTEKVEEVVTFVRNFFNQRGIPFKHDGQQLFEFRCCGLADVDPKRDKILNVPGVEQSEEFDFVFNLVH